MLDSIKYVVVLMLENRSFDNILGGLYGVNQPTVFVPTSNTDSFDGILDKKGKVKEECRNPSNSRSRPERRPSIVSKES